MRRKSTTLIWFVVGLIFIEIIALCSGSPFELKIERRTIREIAQLAGLSFPKLQEPVRLSLNGYYTGLYYVSFQIGSPPHTFTAHVDTGSSDLAIPSTMCELTSCGIHENPYYNPEQSSSAIALGCKSEIVACKKCSQNQCSYAIRYLDGSGYSALVYNDTIRMGSSFESTQIFGAITEVSGDNQFEPYYVDGIMGLAYQTLSRINAPTVLDTFVNAGGKDIFSMCIENGGGSITFGAIAPYYTGKIQYTPIVSEFYYSVQMTDLMVDGQSIGLTQSEFNAVGTIVDSGTSDLIIPQKAYDLIKNAVKRACSSVDLPGICEGNTIISPGLFDGYCFSMTDEQLKKFPTISIELNGGIVVDIVPENWIVQGYCENSRLYAVAISPGAASFGTLLGDTFMRNVLTVFDRKNRRIGFAPVKDCPRL